MSTERTLLERALDVNPIVYINVVSVSKSGLSRTMRVHVVHEGLLYDMTFEVAQLLELKVKEGVLTLRGGNMDMCFQLCRDLSKEIYGRDSVIKYRQV